MFTGCLFTFCNSEKILNGMTVKSLIIEYYGRENWKAHIRLFSEQMSMNSNWYDGMYSYIGEEMGFCGREGNIQETASSHEIIDEPVIDGNERW